MPKVPDHYATLGVSPDATTAEIKKAYRKLARGAHPDLNPDDVAAAEERFKAINEAHEVLGDETRRARYDQARSGHGATPYAPPRPRKRDSRLNKLLNELEGTPAQPGDEAPPRPSRPAPNRDSRLNRVLDNMEQAAARPPRGTVSSLRSEARREVRKIVSDGDGKIHQGDAVKVGGASYSFRRVKFSKPGDATTYRTKTPVLCRDRWVLEDLRPIAAEHLKPGRSTDYQLFVHDSGEVAAEFVSLWTARNWAAQVADELVSMLVRDEKITSRAREYARREVTFSGHGKTFTKQVLCWNDVIFNAVDGEPVSPSMRFASKAEAKEFLFSYVDLRTKSAQKSAARGKPQTFGLRSAKHASLAQAARVL